MSKEKIIYLDMSYLNKSEYDWGVYNMCINLFQIDHCEGLTKENPNPKLLKWIDSQIVSKIFGIDQNNFELLNNSSTNYEFLKFKDSDKVKFIVGYEDTFEEVINNKYCRQDLYSSDIESFKNKYSVENHSILEFIKLQNENKTLLILGNGSNLEMGYPTTWFKYWEDRLDVLWNQLLLAIGPNDKILDKLVSETLKLESSHFEYFSEFEKDNNINEPFTLSGFISKDVKNYIILSLIFRDTLLVEMSLFDFMFSGLYFFKYFENNDKYSNVSFEGWQDIESCIDSLKSGFEKSFEGSNVFLSSSTSSYCVKFLGVIYRYSNSVNFYKGDNLVKHINLFENSFKDYLNRVTFKTNVEKDKYFKFIMLLMTHRQLSLQPYQYDILDFNYESLHTIFSRRNSNLDFIIQPHGNVTSGIVIGGNDFGSKNMHNTKNCLNKFNRKLFKKYMADANLSELIDISSDDVDYTVDLGMYDTVIIYGWSINELDLELFRTAPVYGGDVVNYPQINRKNHHLNIIILTNDDFKLNSKDSAYEYKQKIINWLTHVDSVTSYSVEYKSYTSLS